MPIVVLVLGAIGLCLGIVVAVMGAAVLGTPLGPLYPLFLIAGIGVILVGVGVLLAGLGFIAMARAGKE